MEILLTKIHSSELSNYDGFVLVPIDDNIDEIPNEVAAQIRWTEKVIRTIKQNAAIHKYCSLLATAFEEGGFDMQTVLERAVPVQWTMASVKEVIWKRIQTAMYNKESTTQLETHEVTKVYEQIARHMATEFKINISFPNRFGD